MKPSAEEVATVLDKAHDELLVRGWTQHELVNEENGRVCALGALSVAGDCRNPLGLWTYPQYSSDLNVRAAAELLTSKVGPEWTWLDAWNDEPETTLDDVLDLFRTTSKELREEAGAS